MKKNGHIACLLCLISLWMLVVPVIPHHHHADGMLCMKGDIPMTACNDVTDEQENKEHCCCNTGCIATHFFQQAPATNNAWTHPSATPLLLFHDTLSAALIPQASERQLLQSKWYYRGILYDQYIKHAIGMRAPPVLAS